MTEAMPFLQKCEITFLRPRPFWPGGFVCRGEIQMPLVGSAGEDIPREAQCTVRRGAEAGFIFGSRSDATPAMTGPAEPESEFALRPDR